MKQLDTIAIIGVGLIGASIGLAVRQRGLAKEVIGIGRAGSKSLPVAKQRGAVTSTTSSIEEGVASADLVVVCTPVDRIVADVQTAAQFSRRGALLTDAGSTKSNMVDELSRTLAEDVAYVGSHPMAGSHRSGPEHGDADLFEGRTVVMTPIESTDETVTSNIEEFWQAIGANVLRMSPMLHDEAVATISHLPHVVAAALAAATPHEQLAIASTGWSDTTRVAGGDAQLWRQILTDNRNYVLKSLDSFGTVLDAFRDALANDNGDRLCELLQTGKDTRDRMEDAS